MSSYLVIAPQGLGDALEATVIVGAIKKAQPDARIDVAVLRPGPRQLFSELRDHVDDVLYFPYWERGMLAFGNALLRSVARSRRYDASLLAYPAARPEYHVLARLHGASTRVSHDYWPGSWSSLQWLQTMLVPVGAKHNVQRNLDLVRAIGIEVDPGTTYVVPPSWVGSHSHAKRIAIHVGTVTHHGLGNKRWPLENFQELSRRFACRSYEICVISGPDEAEESKKLVESVHGARFIQGSLDEIARFLSECAAAVTNDSGIGHLAAAVGTRVLALHGPTPVEGGPYGPQAERFRPSPCPPCFDPRLRNTSCALDIDFACLKRDLGVDAVEARLVEMVEKRSSGD